MEVIPAIDILGGKCVRLFQGDYSKETVFSNDPVSIAKRWASGGAPRIHVVDLDGAAQGKPVNAQTIGAIAAAVSIPVQVGGGLRSMEAIYRTLSIGVQRVVLGTAAAEDQALVKEAVERFGDAIIIGVDAREGLVATHGWKEQGTIRAADLVRDMEAFGVSRFIYTDIARDGAMQGPNFEAIAAFAAGATAQVIASGGVSTLDHLRSLAGMNVEGSIVGRALYTGDIDLAAALEAVAETSESGP